MGVRIVVRVKATLILLVLMLLLLAEMMCLDLLLSMWLLHRRLLVVVHGCGVVV